jgi:hypothetical protein
MPLFALAAKSFCVIQYVMAKKAVKHAEGQKEWMGIIPRQKEISVVTVMRDLNCID